MLNSKTAIVTGSLGFIGQALIQELKSHSWKVIEIDLKCSESCLGPEIIIEKINNDEFDKKNTIFFHVGASANAAAKTISELHYTNVELTERYFEVLSIKQIPTIFISSAAIYGNGEGNTNLSPYAESKFLGERILQNKQQKRSWPAIIFRLFNTYGPGEGSKGNMVSVPRQFINSAQKMQEIKIWSVSENKIQSRDFIEISDVVKILHDASISQNIYQGGIFDLGTGTSTSFLAVAEIVSDYIRSTIRRVPFPESQNLKHYQIHTRATNLYTAKSESNFRFIPLNDGLANYISAILEGNEV